jgi:hypothetical protein
LPPLPVMRASTSRPSPAHPNGLSCCFCFILLRPFCPVGLTQRGDGRGKKGGGSILRYIRESSRLPSRRDLRGSRDFLPQVLERTRRPAAISSRLASQARRRAMSICDFMATGSFLHPKRTLSGGKRDASRHVCA